MHEIICPHCVKAFKIDESGYADILKQVRDSQFDQQLHERLELAEKDKLTAVELATTRLVGNSQRDAAVKDAEIQELKAKIDASELAQTLAVNTAVSAVEKDRAALANELVQAKRDKQAAIELAEAKLANALQMSSATTDAEIQGLKAKLDHGEVERQLAVSEAQKALEKDRDALANELEQAKLDKQAAAKLSEAIRVNELQKAAATKDAEIHELKSGLERAELEKQLAEKDRKSVV